MYSPFHISPIHLLPIFCPSMNGSLFSVGLHVRLRFVYGQEWKKVVLVKMLLSTGFKFYQKLLILLKLPASLSV